MTALIGALTLAGGLLLAAAAPALAPPGGIEQFPFPSMSDFPAGGLALGADGNVWFTEYSSGKGALGLITPEGKVNEYVIPTSPSGSEHPVESRPIAIAQGPGGNMWFTEDGVDGEARALIGEVILKQGEPPQIKEFQLSKENFPNQIAAGPEGDMWFTDEGASVNEIGRITPKGEVTLYPLPAEASSSTKPTFADPVAITRGPGGYMWFTEAGPNDEGKSFIGRIGTGISGTSVGNVEEFLIPPKNSGPKGIAQGPNGNIWFVEAGLNQIGEITPSGDIQEFPVPSTSYSAVGIAPGPDGNMWFTEEVGNSVGRITPSGEVAGFPISTRNSDPQGIVEGAEGNMWFLEDDPTEVSPTPGLFYHIGRLTTPFLPASLSPPTISGTPAQGQALTASQGSWSNNPGAFAYQWQDCDASGGSCSNLSGETGVTHFVTAGDVGHTLRVVVTATNVAGSVAAVSGPSAVVVPPPKPPVPLPRVEASMTWTFGWTRKYSVVESLVVHGVPKGGHVEVVCHGHGCPFAHHRSATVARHQKCHGRKCSKAKKRPAPQGPEVNLTRLFKGRHLDVGASISISVVKSGWIGKSFVFTMRSKKTPRVQTACLAPGSSKPGKGC